MSIVYVNGATADNPVIKGLEAEIDRLDLLIESATLGGMDVLITMHKREALMRVYRQFTQPFSAVLIG